jgi:hypothetical protein
LAENKEFWRGFLRFFQMSVPRSHAVTDVTKHLIHGIYIPYVQIEFSVFLFTKP